MKKEDKYWTETCPFSYRIRNVCEYGCCRCYKRHPEVCERIGYIICLLIKNQYNIKDYDSLYKAVDHNIKMQVKNNV
jgi:hypothetical protein